MYNQKYNLTPEIPNWLDLAAEQKIGSLKEKETNKNVLAINFILSSFKALIKANNVFTIKQITEITSVFFLLTNGGRSYGGNNLSRWTITENFVRIYKTTHGGKSPKWYSFAKGFYRAFNGFEDFYLEWVQQFLPKPKQSLPGTLNGLAGHAFWADQNWFGELVKIPELSKNSEQSFNFALEKTKALFVQHILSVKLTGKFDEATKKAIETFQSSRKLETVDGILNNETYNLIFKKWKEKNK